MTIKSMVGSLQLPIAGLGTILCVSALTTLMSLPPSPPGEGFVRGLALVVLFITAWAGFVIASLGLAIPPGDTVGIQFNRWQRRLFLLAGALAVLSAATPLVFWVIVGSTNFSLGSAGLAWVIVMGLAILSLGSSIVWRIGQAAFSHLNLGQTVS